MQIRERRNRHPWLSHLHGRAGGSIEHPGDYDRDDTWSDFNMDDLTVSPKLAVKPPKHLPLQRVPPIADDNLIPDMGRMTP